jgi:archaellum component FlaF (FlaF/FlaG flagellin family)
MEKVITSMLLMIAAIVASVVVINSVMPSVQRTGTDITAASDVVGDRLRTDVRVIEATGAPDSDQVYIWVKNTGASSIPSIEKTDVFFGETNNFERIAYDDQPTCPTPVPGPDRPAPCWQYGIENGAKWTPWATVRITIYLDYDLVAGTDYVVKIVLPNGIQTSETFSV